MVIRLSVIAAFIGILFAASALGQQYTISTIVGSPGNPGFAGDNGSAASAQLNYPVGLAFDKSGNLYIADGLNNRIRKVSGGVITTVAGNGTAGYTGDKGPATSAELSNPTAVAFDSSGNMYIADTGNQVIRMVTNGTITTFAGNNSIGYSGDGNPANTAQLSSPVGVALDSANNLYIADAGNNVIRQVVSGTINTFAQGFTHPDGVAIDSAGNLYVADTGGRRIVEISNGVYTTLAGNGNSGFRGDNGPGNQASLYDPFGLALDPSGNVYIADTFNCRIRKLAPSGIITTIAGNGTLYFSGDGGPATQAALHFPNAVAVDSAGNVYIADTDNSVVRELQGMLPVVSANGLVNAASFATRISPGAIATVFGSNFALTNAAAAQIPLPSSLESVSVSVNGQLAPILYVNPSQVNFQVPWETALGPATVTVAVNGGASNAIGVNVLGAAPGLFSQSSGHAVVQNSDYTLNAPGNPAKAGSTIIAYLSGSGPVNPTVADGALTPLDTLVSATSPSSATIGSSTALVAFAGLAPGFVGLVQVNVVVPSNLPTGEYPLSITIGSETSNAATISVTQ